MVCKTEKLPKSGGGRFVFIVLFALLALYTGGYVQARSQHRLVRDDCGSIAAPGGGFGVTQEELLYFPLCWLEYHVRACADEQ